MAVSCRWVEDRLVDAIDRRLGAADELRLLGHLESCPGCAEGAGGWSRLVPSLRAVEPLPPTPLRMRRMEAAIERAVAAAPARRAVGFGGGRAGRLGAPAPARPALPPRGGA